MVKKIRRDVINVLEVVGSAEEMQKCIDALSELTHLAVQLRDVLAQTQKMRAKAEEECG